MKSRLSFLLMTMCLFFSCHAFSDCEYIAPTKSNPTYFQEMIQRADDPNETFNSMRSSLINNKDTCHQFIFKYPLQNADHAKEFAEVMRLKAREAHRFVPVIMDCQVIEPRNLGFSRKVEILNGPNLQEHVLVDLNDNNVIFIEEFFVLPNGETYPGIFTALNSVNEEDGQWYFSGIYLYGDQPTEIEIEKRKDMFKATYENMILTIDIFSMTNFNN